MNHSPPPSTPAHTTTVCPFLDAPKIRNADGPVESPVLDDLGAVSRIPPPLLAVPLWLSYGGLAANAPAHYGGQHKALLLTG